MKKEQKKHYDKVAQLGCVLCRVIYEIKDSPAELHHIRRFGGKRENAPVIPLCPEHHRGNTGVHGLGHKGFASRYGVDEQTLLETTMELLNVDS